MSAATETDTSLEVLEALDFHPENPCEGRDDCPGQAKWYAINKCCGHTATYCESCKALISNSVSEFWPFIKCVKCDARAAGPDCVRWEPIP